MYVILLLFSDKISRLIISSPSSLVAGVAVTFTARVELQYAYGTVFSPVVSYHWSYSDGIDSGAIHVFNEAGVYQVNCTAIKYFGDFSNSTLVTVGEGILLRSNNLIVFLKPLAQSLKLTADPSVAAVNQTVTLFVKQVCN